MKLYHGSNIEIQEIDLNKSHVAKDFGCGFYLSSDLDQAKQMAQFKALTFGGDSCISTFDFDENLLKSDRLKVKIFEDYTEEWAIFVLANRKNASRENVHEYDVVIGPIADDKVGPQIRRFENGDIDLKELINRLKYMHGGTSQYFFGTERAIQLLKSI